MKNRVGMNKHEKILIETADGPMDAFQSAPSKPALGAVIVVQEAFGVTSHIVHVVATFADAGWHAVAPAFFHRQGSPVFDYGDIASVMPIMGQLTAEGLKTDLSATCAYLKELGFGRERTGVVGYCMGGSVSYFAATTGLVGAAVTYYGGGILKGRFGLPSMVELVPSLQAPWLGLFGDLDTHIPSDEVEQLKQAAASASVATEVVRYANADHGFNCDDRPSVYNAAASADAFKRTLAWFERHLGL